MSVVTGAGSVGDRRASFPMITVYRTEVAGQILMMVNPVIKYWSVGFPPP
jgi:hypothetical protein